VLQKKIILISITFSLIVLAPTFRSVDVPIYVLLSLFALGFLGISLVFGQKANINYVYSLPVNPGFVFSNQAVLFLSYLFFIIISGSLAGYLIYFLFKKYESLFDLKHIRIYFWIVLIFCFLLSLKVSFFILRSRT